MVAKKLSVVFMALALVMMVSSAYAEMTFRTIDGRIMNPKTVCDALDCVKDRIRDFKGKLIPKPPVNMGVKVSIEKDVSGDDKNVTPAGVISDVMPYMYKWFGRVPACADSYLVIKFRPPQDWGMDLYDLGDRYITFKWKVGGFYMDKDGFNPVAFEISRSVLFNELKYDEDSAYISYKIPCARSGFFVFKGSVEMEGVRMIKNFNARKYRIVPEYVEPTVVLK